MMEKIGFEHELTGYFIIKLSKHLNENLYMIKVVMFIEKLKYFLVINA